MKNIKRRSINWEKTGRNLQILRADNISLRRYVCRELNYDKGECSGDCDNCRFDMDTSISRTELGKVFHVSDSVVFNWENGITPVDLEDMLFYCQISEMSLEDILVYD